MTADEIASIRALLRSLDPPTPQPASGLISRVREQLAARAKRRSEAPASFPALEPSVAESVGPQGSPVADPPPSVPPLFGRREDGEPGTHRESQSAAPHAAGAGRLRLWAPQSEGPSDLDENADRGVDTAAARRSSAKGPTLEVVGGHGGAPPQGASRRILQRLEAVFVAERQALKVRSAA